MTADRFKIRFAKPNELNRVGQLVAKLRQLQQMEDKYQPKLATLERDLLQLDERGELFVKKKNTFVAIAIDQLKEDENESHIVGYMIYTHSFSIQHGGLLDLNQIFIDDTHRNLGLGEKFIEFISLHAKLLDIDKIQLFCYKYNLDAIRFYKRAGFYNADHQSQLWKRLLEAEMS